MFLPEFGTKLTDWNAHLTFICSQSSLLLFAFFSSKYQFSVCQVVALYFMWSEYITLLRYWRGAVTSSYHNLKYHWLENVIYLRGAFRKKIILLSDPSPSKIILTKLGKKIVLLHHTGQLLKKIFNPPPSSAPIFILKMVWS